MEESSWSEPYPAQITSTIQITDTILRPIATPFVNAPNGVGIAVRLVPTGLLSSRP